MRFVLAFVAILVVSWASHGQAAPSGAGKSVKEIASSLENPKTTSSGAKKSVKEIALSLQNTKVSLPKGSSGNKSAQKMASAFENPGDSPGAKKSVKDIASALEKPQAGSPQTPTGAKKSVKQIAYSIESLTASLLKDSIGNNSVKKMASGFESPDDSVPQCSEGSEPPSSPAIEFPSTPTIKPPSRLDSERQSSLDSDPPSSPDSIPPLSYDSVPSSSESKTVIVDGEEKSVQDLIQSYEDFKNSIAKSPRKAAIANISEEDSAEVEAALMEGKKLDETHPICQIDPDFDGKRKPWWCFLCIP